VGLNVAGGNVEIEKAQPAMLRNRILRYASRRTGL
jgi:hypothetical protein